MTYVHRLTLSRDMIAPNVSRSSPSRRVNDRRRAATTYNDRWPRWLALRHEGDHLIFTGPVPALAANGRKDVDCREIIKSRNDDLSSERQRVEHPQV